MAQSVRLTHEIKPAREPVSWEVCSPASCLEQDSCQSDVALFGQVLKMPHLCDLTQGCTTHPGRKSFLMSDLKLQPIAIASCHLIHRYLDLVDRLITLTCALVKYSSVLR